MEEAEAEKRVRTAVGTMETLLQEMSSMNQLGFVPQYREYLGLGSQEANLNLH